MSSLLRVREDATASVELPVVGPAPRVAGRGADLRARLRVELRRPATWVQLLRFAIVGASGYVVNLGTFWVALHLTGAYEAAAVIAFLAGVTNNFVWNRHWTFSAAAGHAGRQAIRFLLVSLAAFGLNLAALELLVRVVGMAELPAQAIAVLGATPFSFCANKLWSFRA